MESRPMWGRLPTCGGLPTRPRRARLAITRRLATCPTLSRGGLGDPFQPRLDLAFRNPSPAYHDAGATGNVPYILERVRFQQYQVRPPSHRNRPELPKRAKILGRGASTALQHLERSEAALDHDRHFTVDRESGNAKRLRRVGAQSNPGACVVQRPEHLSPH